MNSQADIEAILVEAESLASDTEAQLEASRPAPPAGSEHGPGPKPSRTASRLPPDLQRVLKIQVPVIVRLAHRQMPVSQIMKLAPGSIIEFDKNADEPLDLMTKNTCIGYGTAIKVGENFGVRVTTIIDAKGKLQALAQE